MNGCIARFVDRADRGESATDLGLEGPLAR
jgi:hypothetical protein